MAEAGYPSGFAVTLHCPNDRYLNRRKICQAVVGMLGQIGIKVTLDARSKSIHFPEIQKLQTDFYLLAGRSRTSTATHLRRPFYHTLTGRSAASTATRFSERRTSTRRSKALLERHRPRQARQVDRRHLACCEPYLNYIRDPPIR